MKFIPLTQGKFALVDDEDFAELSKYKWRLQCGCYASRVERLPDGGKRTFLMHRQILNPPDGMVVDHRSGNGLINIRANLRVCTRAQNVMNQKKHRNNTSGFRGVIFCKSLNKWQARIGVNWKTIYLGYYDSKELAAEAYAKAAKLHHGDFARTS